MFQGKRIAVAVAAIAVAAMSAAPTQGRVSSTINLHAYVPVYCNVDLVPGIGAAGQGVIDLGRSQEFCNAPRGYRIVLQHPTDLPNAAVISDAARIPLSPGGETVLVNSDHPGFQLRQLALDLGDEPATVNRLGLRIEVKY